MPTIEAPLGLKDFVEYSSAKPDSREIRQFLPDLKEIIPLEQVTKSAILIPIFGLPLKPLLSYQTSSETLTDQLVSKDGNLADSLLRLTENTKGSGGRRYRGRGSMRQWCQHCRSRHRAEEQCQGRTQESQSTLIPLPFSFKVT